MSILKNRHNNHHTEYDIYGDIEKIKAALRDATNDVKGRAAEILEESTDDIQKKATAVKESVEEYTATKPFKSLGIALAVGIAIGYLIRR